MKLSTAVVNISSVFTLSSFQSDAFNNSKSLRPIYCAIRKHTSPMLKTMALAADKSNSEAEEDGTYNLPASGSFFNEVPTTPKVKATNGEEQDNPSSAQQSTNDIDTFNDILKNTKVSTGGGKGFSTSATVIKTTNTDSSGAKKTFVGIGKPVNDIQNPEYDENGYTLYADEETGEKKRVFEALVEYPNLFKMKIIGKDDEDSSFAPEIVDIVAKSCCVDKTMVKNSSRKNGQWTSVTVDAPVKDADMLYSLYEDIDKNPRVKFKF